MRETEHRIAFHWDGTPWGWSNELAYFDSLRCSAQVQLNYLEQLVLQAHAGAFDHFGRISGTYSMVEEAMIEFRRFAAARPLLSAATDCVVAFEFVRAPSWFEAVLWLQCELIVSAICAADPLIGEILMDAQVPVSDEEANYRSQFSIEANLEAAAAHIIQKVPCPIDTFYVCAEIDREVSKAAILASQLGIKFDLPARRKLTDLQQAVFDVVRKKPGLTEPQIREHLRNPVGTNTLYRHVFPALREYGLKNKRGHGYYIQ